MKRQSFLHDVLALEHRAHHPRAIADDSAAVTELPTFKAFQDGIADRCEIPPKATRLAVQLVDSYGFRDGASP